VFLGAPPEAGLEGGGSEAISLAECQVPDLFALVALLAARLAGRRTAPAAPVIEALVTRLQAARYAVFVWETGALPAHGALIAEAIQRLVNTLNRRTRAAAFCLGGSDGGYTANQVLTWLSGLPLRTGVRARSLVHEPQRYAAARLVADGAVDALLWVASFTADLLPPEAAAGRALPQVVLGQPELAGRLPASETRVFIPVATPGIGTPGHLFRADGGVVVPLTPLYADPLPSVAQVAGDLAARLAGGGVPSFGETR
jgi:formylmethanofuran dehydrogenase subunit B